ncbi:MAG: N-acetyltransferase family protein [Capsulimonadaceae bacterium]
MTEIGTTLTIRRATSSDAETLIRLITALAEFEHLPPPDEAACARLVEHGFGDRPRFEAWIADLSAEGVTVAAGYAFLFETYSTFLARPSLYLEDLFVLPEHRHQGIGNALLRHCAALALARGCGRMEWTCLDWNVRAQAIYESMGAVRMSEWYLYRMTRPELEAYEGETGIEGGCPVS